MAIVYVAIVYFYTKALSTPVYCTQTFFVYLCIIIVHEYLCFIDALLIHLKNSLFIRMRKATCIMGVANLYICCVSIFNIDKMDTGSIVFATGGYDHSIKFWYPHDGVCYRTAQHPESVIVHKCLDDSIYCSRAVPVNL